MPKIDINKVAEILKKNQVEPALLRTLVEEMNIVAQVDAKEDDKPPALKKQWAIILSDPEGDMPKMDFVGWVVQLPEDESVVTAMERIHKAVYEFNATKKGRLMPVKTVGEALENVPAKHFKESDLWVKTKIPVLVLKTDNEIPVDKTAGRRRD